MPERTIASETVYQGKILRLRIDTVAFDDGRTGRREVVEHNESVAVVPLDADGNVLLVRQFRSPLGRELLEIPAGSIDDGEDPATAVQRELQEETGYRATTFLELCAFWPLPGYCDEYMHLYLAEGLQAGALDPDDDEEISVERVPLATAVAMVLRGEIQDAKSIAGILQVARLRQV